MDAARARQLLWMEIGFDRNHRGTKSCKTMEAETIRKALPSTGSFREKDTSKSSVVRKSSGCIHLARKSDTDLVDTVVQQTVDEVRN